MQVGDGLADGGVVHFVAGPDIMRDWPAGHHHHGDDHLDVVRLAIAAVAVLGEAGRPGALEVGAGDRLTPILPNAVTSSPPGTGGPTAPVGGHGDHAEGTGAQHDDALRLGDHVEETADLAARVYRRVDVEVGLTGRQVRGQPLRRAAAVPPFKVTKAGL